MCAFNRQEEVSEMGRRTLSEREEDMENSRHRHHQREHRRREKKNRDESVTGDEERSSQKSMEQQLRQQHRDDKEWTFLHSEDIRNSRKSRYGSTSASSDGSVIQSESSDRASEDSTPTKSHRKCKKHLIER